MLEEFLRFLVEKKRQRCDSGKIFRWVIAPLKQMLPG
jgi:hypothetical protein